jgi:hypothetical protein
VTKDCSSLPDDPAKCAPEKSILKRVENLVLIWKKNVDICVATK